MTPPDSADGPPSTRHDRYRSFHLTARTHVSAAQRRFVKAAHGRFQGSSAQTFLRQLRALDFVNSIVLFGASLLLSVLPFIILLSSLANHQIDIELSRHIGLNNQGARIVSQLFRSTPAHSAAPILTALIFAAAGTMAVADSLQVIYEQVFGQEHRGWRDVLRFLTWICVLFGVLVTESVIRGPVGAGGGPVAQGLVTYAGMTAFLWWTMHFLLAGRVPWRRLIRAAILTTILWIGLELFSSAYFSSTIITDSRLYGTIGVVFTLLTWFIAIGAVIMLGAVAGATWNHRNGSSDHEVADPARSRSRPGNTHAMSSDYHPHGDRDRVHCPLSASAGRLRRRRCLPRHRPRLGRGGTPVSGTAPRASAPAPACTPAHRTGRIHRRKALSLPGLNETMPTELG